MTTTRHGLWFLLLGVSFLGCVTPAVTQTGPEIHLRIEGGFHIATDTDVDPHLTNTSTTDPYTLDVRLDSTDGTEMNKDGTSGFPVTSIVDAFAVPGTTIADSTYDNNGASRNLAFTRHDQITIPLSSKGQVVTVHIDAMDARGLHSNAIDLSLALR